MNGLAVSTYLPSHIWTYVLPVWTCETYEQSGAVWNSLDQSGQSGAAWISLSSLDSLKQFESIWTIWSGLYQSEQSETVWAVWTVWISLEQSGKSGAVWNNLRSLEQSGSVWSSLDQSGLVCPIQTAEQESDCSALQTTQFRLLAAPNYRVFNSEESGCLALQTAQFRLLSRNHTAQRSRLHNSDC